MRLRWPAGCSRLRDGIRNDPTESSSATPRACAKWRRTAHPWRRRVRNRSLRQHTIATAATESEVRAFVFSVVVARPGAVAGGARESRSRESRALVQSPRCDSSRLAGGVNLPSPVILWRRAGPRRCPQCSCAVVPSNRATVSSSGIRRSDNNASASVAAASSAFAVVTIHCTRGSVVRSVPISSRATSGG